MNRPNRHHPPALHAAPARPSRGGDTSNDNTQVARIKVSQVRAHDTNVRRQLGDLRDLIDSVERFGIMQPITVEKRPGHWLLRDGHRRIAVATMLGIERVPALVHGEHLDDDEWLTHAVHHNQRRRQLDKADRAHTVTKMRDTGMSWDGIAREFGVSVSTVQKWVNPNPTKRSRKSIGLATVARFAGSWMDAVEAGEVTAEEAMSAFVQATETGHFADHLPHRATLRGAA